MVVLKKQILQIVHNARTMKKTPTTTQLSLLQRLTQHQPAMLMSLQGWRRRALFVISFEVLAISCSSFGLSQMSDQSISHASVMGAACSAIAVAWNWLFNSLFEKWESRQASTHRTLLRRAAHALGFEIPLLVGFVLLFTWWFDISYVQALLMDLALFAFFLVFTFLYTWGFDVLFGQPLVKASQTLSDQV
jgi:uncharacterized membrane protein